LQKHAKQPHIRTSPSSAGGNGQQQNQIYICQHTLTASKGMLVYKQHASAAEIIKALAVMVEGNRASSLTPTDRRLFRTELCVIFNKPKEALAALGHSAAFIERRLFTMRLFSARAWRVTP
jgi:hypothetical protein